MNRWRLLNSSTVLSTPWLSVFRNQYEMPRGAVIDDYYIVERNDFVLVVAIENRKLILVRQYRPATDRSYLALPAGYLQIGESPEAGAKRELLEETGSSAVNTRLIGELHPLPGYVRSIAFVVLCEVSTANTGQVDESEITEVLRIDFETVVQMVARGEINEMQSVSAILLAKEILASRG